jgi:hypothetical protein
MVVDTTITPSRKTKRRMVQTKVEKKVPKDVDNASDTA